MKEIDWGMIGAIGTIIGILVTIIIAIVQSKKSEKQEAVNRSHNQDKSKQNTQDVKGLFVINNEIKQENK